MSHQSQFPLPCLKNQLHLPPTTFSIFKSKFTMKLIITLLLFVYSGNVFAQSLAFEEYNKRNKKTQHSMPIILGSWAIANFAGSAALMNNPDAPVNKYFYHMNIYWNVVNAAIAGISLVQFPKRDFNFSDTVSILKNQKKLEKVMLVNMCLDVAYIGSGLLMSGFADQYKKNPDLMEGFGKSIIFQGGFLLLFDTTYYFLYRNNGKRVFNFNYSVSATPGGLNFRMLF